MSEPSTIGLHRQAAEATAAGSKSFYFATRFFPPELARAAHGVYWFCRTTDDMVDEATNLGQAARDLEAWDEALRSALRNGTSENGVLRLFSSVVREYSIPHEYAFDLLEGMRMDLRGQRYETFEELKVFCYRVASVVGLMMMHVIGFRGEAHQHAVDLGIALQLTNILRDIGEDARRNRVYLPAEEMQLFDYSEVLLKQSVVSEHFKRLMRFQCQRARRFYASAAPGIPMLNAEGRFAVEVAARVYEGILSRIEGMDYAVFTHRAVVPTTQKYWITARSMAVPVLRRYLHI